MPIYANPIGAMMQGYKSGQGVQDMRRENALRQLYEQQGAGIAAGDQNALNALAQLDPMAALDVRRANNADRRADRADQRADAALNISQERLAMAKEQARQEAERLLAAGKAAEVEREAAQVKSVLDNMSMALGRGDMQTFTTIRDSLPEDYQGVTPENFPAVAAAAGASLEGMYEAMDSAKAKPGFRPATPEEAAQYGAKAGQVDEGTGRFYPVNPPKTMQLTSDGRGGFTFTEGAGEQKNANVFGPSSAASMIATIDNILTDEALPYATGVMAPAQNIPGTGARRVGSKMKQLDGQAFLQAFESLKGGGQITEIEGVKATQAIARLDSYQSEEDYREALQELRDLLVLGSSRPEGWAKRRATQQATPDVGAVEDGYRYIGGDPSQASSWEPAN